MESLGLYLLKSAVWLTGFTLVFLIVLRNERYFLLNRIYFLSGIVASILFPLYTLHYAVILPSVRVAYATTPGVSVVAVVASPKAIPLYWWFYLAGIVGIALRLVWQTGLVVRKLRKTGYVKSGSVKLVRTSEYAASFSFFSYVFVNPSITDIETKEIVNHESEHIEQRHWFDLLLVELLCMLQWFNPFVWIYAHLIRQNHEYLADEMALQRTSNPAIYRATLLNQMLGAPVISLANSFNYSLNKKRFKMMKKTINSPFRKLKMLLVLPLIAFVFYAFAKPEYIYPQQTFVTENVNVDGDVVKGKVVKPDGKPLEGTTVVIRNSTEGVITSKEGEFRLKSVPKDAELVFSFVGFKTVNQKADFNQPMIITMVTDTVKFEKGVVAVGYGSSSPVNSDPGSDAGKMNSSNSDHLPLYVIDGEETEKSKFSQIKPDDIESMNVLKDKYATDKYGDKGKYGVIEVISKNPPLYMLDGVIIESGKMKDVKHEDIEKVEVLKGKTATDLYGEKGKNGVVLITTKKKMDATSDKKVENIEIKGGAANKKEDKEVFVVVEQMPEFPGGDGACKGFIARTLRYPAEAIKKGIQGKVLVTFIIDKNGKVENAKVVKGVAPELDAESVRVISLLPDWVPGKQRGKNVDVVYTMPIEFKLQ
jgi:TonB family protein